MDKDSKCIFCKIRDEEVSQTGANKVIYRDQLVFAFHDIKSGSAAEHILLCPLEHIRHVNALNKSHLDLMKHMKVTGEKILRDRQPNGPFRFGFHVPPYYSVDHLHLHCFIGPFTSVLMNYIKYGWFLRSVDKQISLLEKAKI